MRGIFRLYFALDKQPRKNLCPTVESERKGTTFWIFKWEIKRGNY